MPANAPSDAPPLGFLSRLHADHVVDLTERTPRNAPDALEDRILTATLHCLGRWGTAKTTLDDVAKEAGCSRATVYRTFPGGKDALFLVAAERELLQALSALAATAHAAPSLADLLADVLSDGVRAIQQHRVLQYLLEHEKGIILPYITFDGIDPLLALVRACLSPALERYLPPTAASVTAEWVVRIALSYGLEDPDGPALADPEQARLFVATFMLPALEPEE